MGVRILNDNRDDQAALYCSTTDWAFGPVISGNKEHDAIERAELFLEWLPQDARTYTDTDLSQKYTEWQKQEEEQWKRKESDISGFFEVDK